MEITASQFAQVEHGLPTQRGRWRGLPKRFGNWHTIYTRLNRWSKASVLDRVFEQLQRSQVVRIEIEAVSLDSTSIKVQSTLRVRRAVAMARKPASISLRAPSTSMP